MCNDFRNCQFGSLSRWQDCSICIVTRICTKVSPLLMCSDLLKSYMIYFSTNTAGNQPNFYSKIYSKKSKQRKRKKKENRNKQRVVIKTFHQRGLRVINVTRDHHRFHKKYMFKINLKVVMHWQIY